MKNKTLIADLRKKKGLTQEKLADISGLNVRTIQRLESGEDASLETLRCIAEALNVEVMELFESVGSEEKMKQIEAFSLEQKKKNTKVLWWNDKYARPIMLVFWGAIIPMFYILKYVLHIF